MSTALPTKITSETIQDEVLPVGTYRVALVRGQVKPSKAGDSQIAFLNFQVLDGECKGKEFSDMAIVVHSNRTAMSIGHKKLAKIGEATVGTPFISDLAEVMNKPFIAEVKIRPARGDYAPSNEIAKAMPDTDEALPETDDLAF